MLCAAWRLRCVCGFEDENRSCGWASPIFFGPRTLVRTWGTPVELWGCDVWFVTTCVELWGCDVWFVTTCVELWGCDVWFVTTRVELWGCDVWFVTTRMELWGWDAWLVTTCMELWSLDVWFVISLPGSGRGFGSCTANRPEHIVEHIGHLYPYGQVSVGSRDGCGER